MTRTDWIERYILGDVEVFALALMELGDAAHEDGIPSVTLMARDAAESVLALLDALAARHRATEDSHQ